MPDGAWGSKEPSPLERLVAAREAEKKAQRKKDTRVLASLAVVALVLVGGSVFAWLRFAEGARPALVVSNLTPAPLRDYRIGVPREGRWELAINTDAAGYGGSGLGQGEAQAEPVPVHGQPHSLALTLPPLATVIYLADRP